jgi:hypothetical protein
MFPGSSGGSACYAFDICIVCCGVVPHCMMLVVNLLFYILLLQRLGLSVTKKPLQQFYRRRIRQAKEQEDGRMRKALTNYARQTGGGPGMPGKCNCILVYNEMDWWRLFLEALKLVQFGRLYFGLMFPHRTTRNIVINVDYLVALGTYHNLLELSIL